MMKGEINPRHVGKVDQDLAAARANLAVHVPEIRARLATGETPEVAFLFFAQTMLRKTNAHHLAIMFSAAVLALAEAQSSDDPMLGFTVEHGVHFAVRHAKCGRIAHRVHTDDGASLAHFAEIARDHLRKCA